MILQTPLKEIEDETGFLTGWHCFGIGIRPLREQADQLSKLPRDMIQLDFNRSYYDSPVDLAFLKDFPDIKAIQCGEGFSDSEPINTLDSLVSFRDMTFNRVEIDWNRMAGLRDLKIGDYQAKYHPDYTQLTELRSLYAANIPKRYSSFSDFSLQNIRFLSLANSRLSSFSGIEFSSKIEELKLIKSPQFDGSGLRLSTPSLRSLTFISFPKLTSLGFLENMPNLELLRLEKLGSITNFEGVRGHPSLGRIQSPPLRGAKMSRDTVGSLEKLEFISSSLLEG